MRSEEKSATVIYEQGVGKEVLGEKILKNATRRERLLES